MQDKHRFRLFNSNAVRWLWVMILSAVLTACGGGGGGGGGGTTGVAPSITTQPVSVTANAGATASFTVVATGDATLTYQWRKGSTDIPGATAATYTIPATSYLTDHNASFTVVITNSAGTVTSDAATLTLTPYNSSSLCSSTNNSTSDDPLIGYAWHIKNQGTYFASTVPTTHVDLCMGTLWASNVLGTDVKVNVVDSGLEIAHEDLSGQVIAGASYNFINSSNDPTSANTTGDHGTSVAGLIAATRGNALGSAGVAPSAKLMGYNFLDAIQDLTKLGISFGTDPNYGAATADVFNFSAGSDSLSLYSPDVDDDVYRSMTALRGNKGAIFVKSAGNGFQGMGFSTENPTYCNAEGISCQNANQDTTNTQYNAIVVAALGADGSKSSYSTAGSPIWISGFGGEYGNDQAVAGTGGSTAAYKPAMVTTDQSTCASGYSRSGQNKNVLDKGDGSAPLNTACNYTAGFNGTSSAAPTVSGVVALMLQANPNLTWRDVKHILASTARRVNPNATAITSTDYYGTTWTREQGWVLNAAGYYFHNWYGFGLVNAAAAVAMAQSHTAGSLGTYTSQSYETAGSIGTTTIPSTFAGLSKTFTVSGGPGTVEQAEVMVYLSGNQAWCTQIELTSPRGTKSILLNMDTSHSGLTDSNGVRFLSNAFYGEPSAGTWTLKLFGSCTIGNGALSSIQKQQLTIRGH